MKTFLILCTALLLVGCSYSVKVGKKCTPGSTEWSYVWLIKGYRCIERKLLMLEPTTILQTSYSRIVER